MAEERLKDELTQISEHIQQGHNFLLSGGAGSGKTYTLVEAVRWIIENYSSSLVACITYTNAAVKEIAQRVNHENLRVSTIHDFLWDNIKNYQKELCDVVIKLLNTPDSGLQISGMEEIPADYYNNREEPVGISYQEHTNLKDGILSHDEVIIVAHEMFKEYAKLSDILKSRYPFIMIDEYQDTFPMVVEIMLSYLKKSGKKCIIGFFGDAMQCIYDKGIGDLNAYKHDGDKGEVFEVQKLQNRRNPQMVIDLANKIRTDGLTQVPSGDEKAPNMIDGVVKEGQCLFLYTQKDGDVLSLVRSYLSEKMQWDFHDAKTTKELNLTHNLIAGKAGFSTLMEIYSGDPLLKYIKGDKLHTCVQSNISEEEMSEMTFGEILKVLCGKGVDEKSYKPTRGQQDYIDGHISLFEKAKSYNYLALRRTYVENSQLVDDKKQSEDEESKTGSKRSPLVKHLCKIEQAIRLFRDGNVSEFLKETGYTRERSIRSIDDKKKLKASIESLQDIEHKTIQEVIKLADEQNICLIDDKLLIYKERFPYIYDRMMEVPYKEFVNLYNYLEGQTPFSTQHRTKGAEFDNVLVILDNGRWNNYNFDKLFTSTSRTESVVVRTEKIFYVCCTRAMERLAVFYHKPTKGVIDKAQEWFGKENIVEL